MKTNEFLISDRAKNILVENGIFDLEGLTSKTKKELAAMPGLGPTALNEIQVFLISQKLKLKGPVKKAAVDFEFRKFMVEKFLKPEKKLLEYGDNIRVAGNLLKKYPDKEFWSRFSIPFKLNSLLFFYGEKGKEILEKAYFQPKEQQIKIEKVELSNEKFGQDFELKPKSIKDFLND